MISIILPTIRPDGASRCLAAIIENAGLHIDQYEIVQDIDTERVGCPRMVKKLVEKSKGEFICFLGDDTVPQKDFLLNAMEVMKTLPDGWGLVGFNDQRHDGNKLATHWLANKKLLPLLDGEFFHTGYKHTKCDLELLLRCKEINKYVWAQNAIIKHIHPAFKTADTDKDYDRIYSEEYLNHDKFLFWRRSQNNWQTPGEI